MAWSLASVACATTCCCDLSAHFCAIHCATTFGACWLVPTCCTPAGGVAAQAEIATVKARIGKYFTLPPCYCAHSGAGISGLRESVEHCVLAMFRACCSSRAGELRKAHEGFTKVLRSFHELISMARRARASRLARRSVIARAG